MVEKSVPKRQYTEEFKAEAARLALSVGQHEAARRLGVPIAMGWTPPPRKGTVVPHWSFHRPVVKEGVHHEAYSRWGRFGKECLPGPRC